MKKSSPPRDFLKMMNFRRVPNSEGIVTLRIPLRRLPLFSVLLTATVGFLSSDTVLVSSFQLVRKFEMEEKKEARVEKGIKCLL